MDSPLPDSAGEVKGLIAGIAAAFRKMVEAVNGSVKPERRKSFWNTVTPLGNGIHELETAVVKIQDCTSHRCRRVRDEPPTAEVSNDMSFTPPHTGGGTLE